MAPPGTRMVVHNKPGDNTSWGNHGTPGWYIGPSLDHYRCMQCYIPTTGIVHITDTLQYIPNSFDFPNTTTEYYLQQAIGYIISIIQDPWINFLYWPTGIKNNLINHIVRLLQKSTDRSHLQILSLPPMVPQSQKQDLSPPNITNTPAPYPRLVLVFQPPRVQILTTAPTSPLHQLYTLSLF